MAICFVFFWGGGLVLFVQELDLVEVVNEEHRIL